MGDELLARDGRILPVEAVRHQPFHDKVYNLHVAELETYAVGRNSVLVHNVNNFDPGDLNAGEQSIRDHVTQRIVDVMNKAADALEKGDVGQAKLLNSMVDELLEFLKTLP